ncbi:glucosaminidase domain-containing protein [Nocardia brasiliensis]|uniref:Peptidase M15A n=1 Tax=Nocardia brasiliensis (strain ATCC 700358 / HUJEG-1) TaxID=1133849 RepID=K0ER93_NOCB7|nr:glucosaminidase domain-containing protein [Nocardia brasiliensis]AFU02293.1 peptidase M15A [Nocardia brasiliensis ATCC 700358]
MSVVAEWPAHSAAEESGAVEQHEFDESSAGAEAAFEAESFPSGLVLTARPGPSAAGQEHWDPNNTGLPLYDTGPQVRTKKLAPNFTVGELVSSGGRPADRARISPALVRCLQAIRDRVGKPVKITSGYRSWASNVAVYRARGQKPTLSRHCSGQAADITIAGLTGLQIAELAIDACGNDIALGVGGTFAHIDVRGRPDTWTYLTGSANAAALAHVRQYRLNRSTPKPGPTPTPTPTPTRTPDRAAGIVRRGSFTKCATGEQPGARAMANQWKRLTGRQAGTFNCRATTFGTPSLHGEGRSIDLYANAADPAHRAQVDAYLAWLQANAVELQVAYIIWNRRQWGWQYRAQGWRAYGGSNPHTDHIHVDLSWEGARSPSPLFAGPVPGLGGGSAPAPTPKPGPRPSGRVPAHVVDFVRKYRPHAQANETRSRIPWLVTLGQAALETGWGAKACGNNFFGIKAGAKVPEAQRKLCTTTEVHSTPNVRSYPEIISVTPRPDGRYNYVVRAWFRAYASPAESFDGHARVLLQPRYAKAFAHTADPYAFAREVAAAGYATEPSYAATLTGVMKLIETVP